MAEFPDGGSDLWDNGPGGALLTLDFFGTASPSVVTYVWDGASWVAGVLQVWSGTAWETGTPRKWDGAVWV